MYRLLAALTAALACLAGAAQAGGYSGAAKQVLHQARQAAGGSGWNLLRGIHETGEQGGVRYEKWIDPIRYGLRIETHELAGKRVHGFNGAGDWEIRPNGVVTGVDNHVAVSQARTDAFFAAYGFFYPSRFDANATLIGVRQYGGRSYSVLAIEPVGGRPREVWFDRRTHLLSRIVDKTGYRPVTVEVSDHRRVGPVTIAFRFTSDGVGVKDRKVEAVDFRPVDRGLFSLPPPPGRR